MNPMEYLPLEKLPSELRDALGTISCAILECPGVYYIGVEPEDEDSPLADEYYVVEKDAPMISSEVKSYGKIIPGYPDFLLYSYMDRGSGRLLVEYEVGKYKVLNHIPLPPRETLHDIAAFATEKHPEYFGTYPVPMMTPWGYTLRHKAIDNGVYWIETDQCREVLAVNYTLRDDLSNISQLLSRQTIYDLQHGLSETKGYLFFSKQTSCIPLFELMMDSRSYWAESGTIDKAALMNAIWADYPEYATEYNMQEQRGQHDLLGRIRQDFNSDVKLKSSVDNMIIHTPQAGTYFFGFA